MRLDAVERDDERMLEAKRALENFLPEYTLLLVHPLDVVEDDDERLFRGRKELKQVSRCSSKCGD